MTTGARMDEPSHETAEEFMDSLKQSIANRPQPDPTWRCRIFNHKWGAWIDGRWHSPDWVVGGAASHLYCKRCEVRYHDATGRRPTYRVR